MRFPFLDRLSPPAVAFSCSLVSVGLVGFYLVGSPSLPLASFCIHHSGWFCRVYYSPSPYFSFFEHLPRSIFDTRHTSHHRFQRQMTRQWPNAWFSGGADYASV